MNRKPNWTDVPDSTFARFEEPGDRVTGEVLSYSPDEGATTYDGDPCGHLTLDGPDGPVTVGLDKPQLARKVAGVPGGGPHLGQLLQVEFTEWKTSEAGRDYKRFAVRYDASFRPNQGNDRARRDGGDRDGRGRDDGGDRDGRGRDGGDRRPGYGDEEPF